MKFRAKGWLKGGVEQHELAQFELGQPNMGSYKEIFIG